MATSKTLINDVTKLKYLSFNTSAPGLFQPQCQSAYLLWKQQWQSTFKELGTEKSLTSDDFIDRELCGLFDDEKVIGFILYKFMDLRLLSSLDSLYFKNYPDALLARNKNLNDPIMIMSYMTLDPTWRKSNTNFSISELLIGFIILHQNTSHSQRVIGYFRNNRSTNEIFYRHSGQFLMRHTAYNVDVDYAETDTKKSTLSSRSNHALLTFKLWTEFYNQRRNYEFERRIISGKSKHGGRTLSPTTVDK
jgi:hypothetical protein